MFLYFNEIFLKHRINNIIGIRCVTCSSLIRRFAITMVHNNCIVVISIIFL